MRQERESLGRAICMSAVDERRHAQRLILVLLSCPSSSVDADDEAEGLKAPTLLHQPIEVDGLLCYSGSFSYLWNCARYVENDRQQAQADLYMNIYLYGGADEVPSCYGAKGDGWIARWRWGWGGGRVCSTAYSVESIWSMRANIQRDRWMDGWMIDSNSWREVIHTSARW